MLSTRRNFLKSAGLLAAAAALPTVTRCSQNVDRPNILWITSEDNSPLLGCYGDEFATTPNLDKLASEGILFENAFATAPVCAPARCTIITGVYPPSMGTQHMRSRYKIPDSIRRYPEYLREAGYYCTNNSKTDYNIFGDDKVVWDECSREAHYKNRPDGQPFFAIFNTTISHESCMHKSIPTDELRHDPEQVPIPPYHPVNDVTKHDWAQYYDKVEDMDAWAGKKLQELEDAGLAEDTIVFYYADHGGVLARSKRFLFESGLRVPMIVRFPEKYKHLAPKSVSGKTDQIVTFIDLPATLLSLAGIAVPKHMQGYAFAGKKKAEPRKYGQSFRGRMDERYDFSRSIRDKQFRYNKHFNPHRIFGQYIEYLWRAPLTRNWEDNFKIGNTNEQQSAFWLAKPTEELFDCHTDPHNVKNLAYDPEYSEKLAEMRQAMTDWQLDIRDSGFLPEGQLVDIDNSGTIYEYVRSDAYDLERIMRMADMAISRDADVLPQLEEALADPDKTVRFWAATGCLILGEAAQPAVPSLEKALTDSDGDTVAVAAEALCKLGHAEKGVPALIKLLSHDNSKVVLRTTNALDQIGDMAKPALPTLKKSAILEHEDNYVVRAAKYLINKLS